MGHLHAWAVQTDKGALRSVAVQVYGLVADGLQRGAAPYLDEILADLGIVVEHSCALLAGEGEMDVDGEEEDGLDGEWHTTYQMLQSLGKVLQVFPEATAEGRVRWTCVVQLLGFPHAWVWSATCRLLGVLFAASTTMDEVLMHAGMKDVADKLCVLLKSVHLEADVALQAVKNLFFVGKWFEARLTNGGGDVEEEEGRGYSLSCRIKRDRHRLRDGTGQRANWALAPLSVLRFFAAMASHMDATQLERFLPHILTPVYRITEEGTIWDAEMEELKTTAIELQDLVRAKVGTAGFANAYNRIRQGAVSVQQARWVARVTKATTDPEGAAKRKVTRNAMKRESRKRKSRAFACVMRFLVFWVVLTVIDVGRAGDVSSDNGRSDRFYVLCIPDVACPGCENRDRDRGCQIYCLDGRRRQGGDDMLGMLNGRFNHEHAVLLTGSTGGLGSYLLGSLLAHDDVAIVAPRSRTVASTPPGIKQLCVEPRGVSVTAYAEPFAHKLTFIAPELGDKVVLRQLCILRARILVEKLEGWDHSSNDEIAKFAHEFDRSTKLIVKSDQEPAFVRVAGLRYNNAKYGIKFGKLKLSGEGATSLFQESIDAIIDAFERQQKYATVPITTVFCVGGLSTNDWMWSRLQSYFEANEVKICRPDNHMHVLGGISSGSTNIQKLQKDLSISASKLADLEGHYEAQSHELKSTREQLRKSESRTEDIHNYYGKQLRELKVAVAERQLG
ncbi:hypothetical protein JVU11DRAFT_1122 [Chiua virens]|nr:hypothetical protein JVU11DRAFT_1122 [Chiua virens]